MKAIGTVEIAGQKLLIVDEEFQGKIEGIQSRVSDLAQRGSEIVAKLNEMAADAEIFVAELVTIAEELVFQTNSQAGGMITGHQRAGGIRQLAEGGDGNTITLSLVRSVTNGSGEFKVLDFARLLEKRGLINTPNGSDPKMQAHLRRWGNDGFLEKVVTGVWRITDKGLDVLKGSRLPAVVRTTHHIIPKSSPRRPGGMNTLDHSVMIVSENGSGMKDVDIFAALSKRGIKPASVAVLGACLAPGKKKYFSLCDHVRTLTPAGTARVAELKKVVGESKPALPVTLVAPVAPPAAPVKKETNIVVGQPQAGAKPPVSRIPDSKETDFVSFVAPYAQSSDQIDKMLALAVSQKNFMEKPVIWRLGPKWVPWNGQGRNNDMKEWWRLRGQLPPCMQMPENPCSFEVDDKHFDWIPRDRRIHKRVLDYLIAEGRLPPSRETA